MRIFSYWKDEETVIETKGTNLEKVKLLIETEGLDAGLMYVYQSGYIAGIADYIQGKEPKDPLP